MQTLSIEEVLTNKGQEFIEAVITSQKSKGLKASGESARSLRLSVTRHGKLHRLQLLGLARFRFQQSGRGPGKFKRPPRAMVAAIADWLQIKGLDIPAYAVAMKINKEGIDVPNPHNAGGVLSEPLNPKRIRGILKTGIRPVLIQSAKSNLFS